MYTQVLGHLPLRAVLSLRATSFKLLGCTELVPAVHLRRLAFPIPLPHAAAILSAFGSLTSLTIERNVIQRSPKPTPVAAALFQACMARSNVPPMHVYTCAFS